MQARLRALGVAAGLLLAAGCGGRDESNGGPDGGVAHGTGVLEATVMATSITQSRGTVGWIGSIAFEVTVTNGTAEDVFLVDGIRMPYFDAGTSPFSTLTLRWDVEAWRDDISSRPHGFEVPATRRLEAGGSDTWTVLVNNPVGVGNHDMVFWDETTTPPTDLEPPLVHLTQPITVKVVMGYGTSAFSPDYRTDVRSAFQDWQRRLESATVRLVGQ